MAGENRDSLLARIDAALGRMEAALENPPVTDAGLQDRHVALCGVVAETLRELDDLIESHGA